jgi:hypothetical protein
MAMCSVPPSRRLRLRQQPEAGITLNRRGAGIDDPNVVALAGETRPGCARPACMMRGEAAAACERHYGG